MSKLQQLILAVVLVLQASSAWGDVSDNNAGLKVARQTQSINSYYNSYNPYNAWRPWNFPYYPYQQYYQPSARIPRNQILFVILFLEFELQNFLKINRNFD
jgi:hypothetical protein